MTDRTIRQINREDGEWIADYFRRSCLDADVFDKICSTCSITEEQARHILKLRKVNIAQTINDAKAHEIESEKAERAFNRKAKWVLVVLFAGLILALGHCAGMFNEDSKKSPGEQACEDMGGQSNWSGDKCVFLNP